MKPILIQVPAYEDYSFRISNEIVPHFYNPFHYHNELEITYVLKSHGTRFVGDSIESFEVDDLVLVGSNLPHCWKNGVDYFVPNSNLRAQALVVQFKADFAGQLFRLPEMREVYHLIKNAREGIKFFGKSKSVVKQMLLELFELEGPKRITKLIDILEHMAQTNDKKLLCQSYSNANNLSSENIERLNTIFEYTLQNYKNNITLGEISELVHLSPNAFCRYFKLHTRKTYKEFVNEIRVTNACKLLQETSKSVSEIAFISGFHNMSHFIHTFKKLKKQTPREYRKKVGGSMDIEEI